MNSNPTFESLTTRRDFLKIASGAAAACLATPMLGADFSSAPATRPLPEPTAQRLPRWRGFNLLEKFVDRGSGPYRESDFEWIAEFGFNFVRLPMSYRCWADAQDWLILKEPALKEVDQAVELGRKTGLHVNLNLHRAPGYCVNAPAEPLDLWTDEKALDACAFHWARFAKRYKGIPNANVSFYLLNEPKDLPDDTYVRVVKRLAEAIRAEDSQRLIIADGLKYGNQPVLGLASLGVAQSTRGYAPSQVSHYRATLVSGLI